MDSFWQWWSHLPSHINPYVFQWGSFRVGWYGMMYILAFLTCYFLAVYRSRKDGYQYPREVIQDFVVWVAIGLIVGARLGYVVFYNFGYYASHPLEIFLPFSFDGGVSFTGISGMSYHGGAVGVVTAGVIFMRRHAIGFWRFADFFVPVVPLGYTFGRLGNFINGELYGRVTSVQWGMHFPADPSGALRHPSQLYEAFFEGIFLFIVLWTARKRSPFDGFLLGLYLIGYGVVRFFIEFFREPDAHLGFVLGPFSMGQVLCIAMMIAGAGVMVFRGPKRAS